MIKQLIVWQLIHKSLQQLTPVMLLYVVQSEGSSPGRTGFCMAINDQGEAEGSIGGGIMEHKLVELAKEQLQTGSNLQFSDLENTYVDETKSTIKKQFHNKTAATGQSGMICSGEQTILLYRVSTDDAPAIEQLISSLQQSQNGTLQLTPAGIYFTPGQPETAHYFSMDSAKEWLYRERTGYRQHLHIVGAGHCALALSRMAQQLDFFIHLYDDRANLKTFQENNYVHNKTILNDYQELAALIPAGADQYVVIMTVGYRTDDIAVRALWDKQLRYLGLLGSKSKIDKLFTDYSAAGIAAKKLQRIHAPIGMAIHSQTPEEIAVSIAAEIIQVKNT